MLRKLRGTGGLPPPSSKAKRGRRNLQRAKDICNGQPVHSHAQSSGLDASRTPNLADRERDRQPCPSTDHAKMRAWRRVCL